MSSLPVPKRQSGMLLFAGVCMSRVAATRRPAGDSLAARFISVALAGCCLCGSLGARADGDKDGPFEFDHRLHYDSSGIWARKYQVAVEYGLVAGTLGVALYEGSESRMGSVAWKTLDSMLVTAAIVQAAKPVFSRARPSQSDDSGKFFQGSGNRSFPSGEVAHVAAAVTPVLMEYGREQPWLYPAAGTLLIFDSVARMKTRGHWLSDVVAGAGVGAATGYFMERRDKSLIVSALPGGVFVGYKKKW
jgi:undecaprenyl-diphosphatase